MIGGGVVVLPQEAEVLLVHADCVLDRQWLTTVIEDVGIEIADLPEAVTAEPKGIGAQPDAVFADVKRTFTVGAGSRVTVRHDQFRKRGAIDDRAVPLAVAVGDLVQHQPLAWGGKPIRNRQRCQATSQPSTWKLAPSGWWISNGIRPCRGGSPVASGW